MLPLERAKLSVLNAFAVFAFSAEMIRLPGHSAPRFGPVNTTAQTTPSRFTTVPHSWFPNPPFAPLPSLTALVSAAFNLLWSGTFEQSCGFCANTAAGNTTDKNKSNLEANAEVVIINLLIYLWAACIGTLRYRGCPVQLLPSLASPCVARPDADVESIA